MIVGSILGWIIAGLIVGVLARLIIPGRQDIGIVMTIVLGVIGALLAGYVGSMIFGPQLVTDGSRVYAVDTAWPGWLMATLGAAVVLWFVMAVTGSDKRKQLP